MRFGSLFAGIGGMDLGLERAGMECAWQVEIDPYCQRVLTKHWPDVPKFLDVCEVGKHNLPPVDLICGGFPCQDISYAGKGAGIAEGTRSGLWSEYHRIICELRPRIVLVENVPALLSRGLGRVLGDLAASGYNAEWDCIPAAAVGAPHRRDRVFVVADSRGQQHQGGCHEERRPATSGLSEVGHTDQQPVDIMHHAGGEEGGRQASPTGPVHAGDSGGNLANAEGNGRALRRDGAFPDDVGERGSRGDIFRGAPPNGAGEWWATEPDVGRVAYGVPARVDRLRGTGNAVVPQVAEFVGRMIMGKDQT